MFATLPSFLFACSVAALACASDDAHFEVRHAPGVAMTGISLSVFGVYKDGRMSSEAWNELGPKLSPALGKSTCEIVYGGAVVASKPALASKIDDYARESGITDDLLRQFGPMARGDAILVVTMAGEMPRAGDAGMRPSAPTITPRGRRGGGRRSVPRPEEHPRPGDRSTLELSASLYSIRLERSVASIEMTYSGTDLDAALERFRQELETTLPRAICVGWDWNVENDPVPPDR